jgi:hypothetical protein
VPPAVIVRQAADTIGSPLNQAKVYERISVEFPACCREGFVEPTRVPPMVVAAP